MPTLRAFLMVLLMVALPFSAPSAATQINKCMLNGEVTFQTGPCPSAGTGGRPTVAQLNAERQKRLKLASERAASAAAAAAAPAPPLVGGQAPRPAAYPAVPLGNTPAAAYRCDGRTYCSQMSSCAEAKYFLAHCPGVKMDGDGDGIPCEEQFCGH